MNSSRMLTQDEFIDGVCNAHAISRGDIDNSEFIEARVFEHAKLLDPKAVEDMDFPIDGNAQFIVDKKGYFVVAYKKLYDVTNHEKIAYIFNQYYSDIDAHVVEVMGHFSSQLKPGDDRYRKEGYFYSIRFNAKVLLEQVLVKNPAQPLIVENDENKLIEKSKKCGTTEYPLYRTYTENHKEFDPRIKKTNNHSPANNQGKQQIQTNAIVSNCAEINDSEITKDHADLLLNKYSKTLDEISEIIINWDKNDNDAKRYARADTHFIPMLLKALKAISSEENTVQYGHEYFGGMSGLDKSEINNKSPQVIIQRLLTHNPYNHEKNYFETLCDHYLGKNIDLKKKAESFYKDIQDSAKINFDEYEDSQPDDYINNDYESQEIAYIVLTLGMYAYFRNCASLNEPCCSLGLKITLAVVLPPVAMVIGLASIGYGFFCQPKNTMPTNERSVILNDSTYRKV